MMNCRLMVRIPFLLLLINCSGGPEKNVAQLHTVEIKAMQFQPAGIKVKKGDTIVFINRDIVVHDVAEEKSRLWSSDSLSTNESYKMIASATANYFCTIHPVMKGRVVVE